MTDGEIVEDTVQDLARRIAEAVAAGEFELARALTEDAIRVRVGSPASAPEDPAEVVLHETKPLV